ncbi:glycosyltransferase [Candidatus Bathyarchaeota archaeon]|nr:MAG: glycosyltransferase [Candidatus Bathyarchaeota archaeon]
MFFIVFLVALTFFCGTYLAYFLYMRNCAKRPWNLKIDHNFCPEVSILVPMYNEESNIESKLENLKAVSYPRERMEIIVVDDSSEDGSVKVVESFMERNPELGIKLVRQSPRGGKSVALNKALKVASKPIVIVSDADTLWPPKVLREALPYLSDPSVGAITGRGVGKGEEESWAIRAEHTYLEYVNLIRLGESKLHSTIRFEGGFCAFKREAFESFDCETGADDSGTALEVIQNGYRSILVPKAVFYASFPISLALRLKAKVRRANQLIGLWFKCLKLLLKRKLLLPKRIVVPEVTLFIINPIIFLILMIFGVIVVLNPLSPFGLAIILSVVCLLLFARRLFLEVFLDNFVLLYALIAHVFKRRYIAWES